MIGSFVFMKFSKQLKNSATPEWKSQYINYQFLKKQIQKIHHSVKEEEFFELYEKEIGKVNQFFSERLKKFASRHEEIIHQVTQKVILIWVIYCIIEFFSNETGGKKFINFSVSRTLSRTRHVTKLSHLKLHWTRKINFKI